MKGKRDDFSTIHSAKLSTYFSVKPPTSVLALSLPRDKQSIRKC